MTKYKWNNNLYNNDFLYDLKNIIIHSGDVNNGYYYSIIKNINSNSWNLFNDKNINKISLLELKTEEFVFNDNDNSNLFYHKINNVFCEKFDNIK